MADDKRDGKPSFDPFKAEDPVLPGVPKKVAPAPAVPAETPGVYAGPVPGEAPAATGTKLDPKVIGGAAAGVLLLALGAWMMLGGSSAEEAGADAATATSAATPATTGTAPATTPAVPGQRPAVVLNSLPGEVGTVDEFSESWSAKRFTVAMVSGRTPAIIIRLPGGSPRSADSYWGLLLQSPYGRCELEYVTDPVKVKEEYGYRARTPMVVDPCNMTVFNPLRYGNIGGVMARGEVVQGNTLRPPLGIEVRISGNKVIAARTE
jgi:hypothetical protein